MSKFCFVLTFNDCNEKKRLKSPIIKPVFALRLDNSDNNTKKTHFQLKRQFFPHNNIKMKKKNEFRRSDTNQFDSKALFILISILIKINVTDENKP